MTCVVIVYCVSQLLQRAFTDEQIQKKRQKYLNKAYAMAKQLEARWSKKQVVMRKWIPW